MAVAGKKKRGLGRGLGALISSQPVAVKLETEGEQASDSTETSPSKKKASSQRASTSEEKSSSGKASEKIVQMPTTNTEAPPSEAAEAGLVQFVPRGRVVPNPDQPRKFFDEQEVQELVHSIRNHGLLQPILVRPTPESQELQIVAGERRWRAASELKIAQLPVIIREMSDLDCLEISLVENVQRSDLTALEEARGYQELITRFHLTQAEVAEKVGKERATVSNLIRLLKLPTSVQDQLERGEISVGHAKAILTVKEPKLQLALAAKVVGEGMSVRELERIVGRKVTLKSNQRKTGSTSADQEKFRDIVDELQKTLGAKVGVHEKSAGKGKITIDYFSHEELERIAEKICFQQ
ncbi:ParB/RepB/Spo0J family partition protein [bacterium]|nr:ParB/RepB/Spo0J family partition protein [bacterium]